MEIGANMYALMNKQKQHGMKKKTKISIANFCLFHLNILTLSYLYLNEKTIKSN